MSVSSEIQNITEYNYRQILPQRWLEYLHALGTVEGKMHRSYTRNGKLESEAKVEILCLYPFFRETGGRTESPTFAKTYNKNYRFYLGRKEPSDKWFIERLNMEEPSQQKTDDWKFPKHFEISFQKDPTGHDIFIRLGVGLFAGNYEPNLSAIIQSEFFKVNKIEFIETAGKRQVFLDFDYTYKDFSQQMKEVPHLAPQPDWKPYSMQGQVWLETDYYLVVKGKFHYVWLTDERSAEVECEYDCDIYKVPLPKKYKEVSQYDYKEDKMKGVFETLIDFDLRETNPKDEKRFTLSAFGIPEPDLGPKRLSFFRIMMSILGAALIFFAFWRMCKKENKKV